MDEFLREGERLDDLQAGGLRIIQRADGFRFGTDSVLLTDFAAPKKQDKVAELGSGSGAISLLLAYYHPTITIDAVELQKEVAEMSSRSVALNGLGACVRVHCADMRDAAKVLGAQSKTLVVCNPPYWRGGSGARSAKDTVDVSRMETNLTPEDIALSAAALLRTGGRFCVVYPAERLAELICACTQADLEPKRIRCIHTVEGRPPKLVLLECVHGGGKGLKWMEPLNLMDREHNYTSEWKRIYHMET